MRLLLDTSAFLWFIQGDARLSLNARLSIEGPENEVFLSSVSIWEIAVKQGLGKLSLPSPAAQFISREREAQGFLPLPLDESDCVHLEKLPHYHRDPFDRMLICQSLEHGLRLVTSDPWISAYPVPLLW